MSNRTFAINIWTISNPQNSNIRSDNLVYPFSIRRLKLPIIAIERNLHNKHRQNFKTFRQTKVNKNPRPLQAADKLFQIVERAYSTLLRYCEGEIPSYCRNSFPKYEKSSKPQLIATSAIGVVLSASSSCLALLSLILLT